ncbi:heavy-metal-associated domain-containing protein [Kitasatospora sp. NPDC096147]|uniref:heavy-metal-associated domain-containing protein n=1 Tax=Kitasatospora sp. NPDC096147 TaxID=3364093 RepID=UPI003813F886
MSTTAAAAVTTVLTVGGMSCGHCERTVSAALSALPGVTDVTAEAKAERVTVASAAALDEAAVRAAVEGAGFTYTGRA